MSQYSEKVHCLNWREFLKIIREKKRTIDQVWWYATTDPGTLCDHLRVAFVCDRNTTQERFYEFSTDHLEEEFSIDGMLSSLRRNVNQAKKTNCSLLLLNAKIVK